MFLDGCEVVIQVLDRATLNPVQSVCEADGKGWRTLTVSSTAFARMTVYAGRTWEELLSGQATTDADRLFNV